MVRSEIALQLAHKNPAISRKDIDKIIEPDLFKSTKKIPKYDDYEFD